MVKIDKDLIIKHFSKAHSTYDKYSTIQIHAIEKLITLLPKDIVFKRILEIGCGTGTLTQKLRTLFPHSEITAIDISKEMISYAINKVIDVNFINIDAEKLPKEFFYQFDLIISSNSIHWLSNPFNFLLNLTNNEKVILFNTFGNLTLLELKTILNKELISDYFPSKKDWEDFLEANFKNKYTLYHELKKLFYPNLLSLLKTLKYTGTNVNKFNITLSRKKILEMEEKFISYYNGVKATYELIYVLIFN